MRNHFAASLFACCLLMASLASSRALAQVDSIVNSPHNLSSSGPGSIRATSEQQICIFCHTPHNAAPVEPLWNRQTPVSAYRVYSSNSLQALPGQPTGSSKLCLSCHDGTIALGSVVSRTQPITMANGMTTLPTGAKSNLGTDLSDDHPISFRYDSTLQAKNIKLLPPAQLPLAIHLDSNQELQCTSCHDAHNNSFGKFLVMDNSSSQLCNACHQEGTTTVANHVDCASCHQSHTAPSGPYLLKASNVTQTCTLCHNNTPSPTKGADIATVLATSSRHDTNSLINLKPEVPNNIVCNDCHEPHTMGTSTASAPLLSPMLGKIDGVNVSGAAVTQAQYEYEVCFKCHADQAATQVTLPSRKITQANVRLQFASAVSYHPVTIAGASSNVPSLISPMTTGSIIYCTDCHASDNSVKAGGTGPNGPHGSNMPTLLLARYDTADNSVESASAYALCYRCHSRTSILGNVSFHEHSRHVVTDLAPCSVCHDSHGIASGQGTTVQNSHLINFDTSIVQADPVTNRLEYNSTGTNTGTCYLRCHNKNHSPLSYQP